MLGTLGREQIERLLQQECVARIGCHADGVTYIVPVTYWYDGQSAICHSREGLKLQMMRKNPEVCFQVDRLKAMDEWECVIAQGRFEELDDEEAGEALRSFSRWLLPRKPSITAVPDDGAATGSKPVAYRIRLAEKTGRFERRMTSPHSTATP